MPDIKALLPDLSLVCVFWDVLSAHKIFACRGEMFLLLPWHFSCINLKYRYSVYIFQTKIILFFQLEIVLLIGFDRNPDFWQTTLSSRTFKLIIFQIVMITNDEMTSKQNFFLKKCHPKKHSNSNKVLRMVYYFLQDTRWWKQTYSYQRGSEGKGLIRSVRLTIMYYYI